ncbi:hypothetical protein B6N60_04262 [Richelia sinica FACHB-800]|uniref:Calx-beta domain-containing protein n=1 Tax=Richelia sinica FACHB-800 TaxID=1357546 RepID=A0A975TCI3_9NOST|nr:Calx-beta domain-containing protein [Richelia sinica]QXE25547.1 hypothetical protein B6N60_04262 [Richelia sinica FACHB-800]
MIINGTASIDELYAQNNDQIFGLDGDDILDASNGQGSNLLNGGGGKDRLLGNLNDTLVGGLGSDRLYALGVLGNNSLNGNEDNDQLFVVEGGNNQLDGGSGNDQLVISGGSGSNTLVGGLGNDVLNVANGTGNNYLVGGENDDILIGGTASDSLFGGIGDDSLFGGVQGSQLTGGAGLDRFFIASAAIPDTPVEVLDFTKTEDKVIVVGIPEVKSFADLILEPTGSDTTIKASINGNIKTLGILKGIQANSLTPDDFNFLASVFLIVPASANEGNAVTFTITRTGDALTQQSVTVSTSIVGSDTASDSDFVAKTETIVFNSGETAKTFTVQTNQDALFEENETFSVTLTNPTNGGLISATNGTAQGTINNDDAAPIFAIASASGTEGNSITFTITRTGNAQTSQSVTVSTAISTGDTASESDFAAKTQTLTFAQNETSKTFTVETNQDSQAEENETFSVNLTNPTNGATISTSNGTAKGRINDDDTTTTSSVFAIASASGTEGNSINLHSTWTGNAQTSQSVTVSTAISTGDTASESDFAAKTQTLTFAQNETSKTFTVETNQDSQAEENETFSVNLTNPTNGATISTSNGTAKGRINDDDTTTTSSVFAIASASGTEGNSINFTITRTGNTQTSQSVTVSIPEASVVLSNDFVPKTQTLTFQAGDTSQTFSIQTIQDNLIEPDETFNVALSNPTNGATISPTSGTAQGTIIDNDSAMSRREGRDVFTIKGNAAKVRLKAILKRHSSSLVNEIGVFKVDDENGSINGIVPDGVGYTQAALARARVIFSTIANIPNGFSTQDLTSLREFESGDNLRFYIIRNSTTDAVLAGITPSTEVLFSNSLTQKITNLNNGEFSLAWEDGFGTSISDFQDLVVNIQSTNESLPLGTNLHGQNQGEVIDLRDINQAVTADFILNREATFNNFIGFYQVVDDNGGIDTDGDQLADILPGQTGYAQAAVRGRVEGIDLTVNNQATSTFTNKQLIGGAIFAPFIISNGTVDQFLNNQVDQVYFAYLGANPDQTDHIRLLGNNIFGFEDLPDGGDQDFNDVIVRVNLSIE